MEDTKFNALYKKAETFLQKEDGAKGVTPADVFGIMQELSTYRVELDLQNDELEKTRLELEKSRNTYADLYNSAPVAYVTIDENDTLVTANTASMVFFDTEGKLTGEPITQFIASASKDAFYLYKQKLFETMQKQVCEIDFELKDGATFRAFLQGIATKDSKLLRIVITVPADMQKD